MKKIYVITLLFLFGNILSACSGGDDKKSPSQVLAKVNDTEITVHQLNFLLAKYPEITAEQKQKMLDQLVDQELLVQKASELKLDRDPNILQVIEAEKKQILARAAAEKILGKPTEPNKNKIDEFYSKNPALFSERKIYEFTVFSFEKSNLNDLIISQLNQANTEEKIKNILDSARVKYEVNDSKKNSEQLPMAMLPKFNEMKKGDILSLSEGNKTLLLQLKDIQPMPVNLAEAEPMIKKYLMSNEVILNSENKIKSLRSAAKITYLKKFYSEPAIAAVASSSEDSLKAGLKGLK